MRQVCSKLVLLLVVLATCALASDTRITDTIYSPLNGKVASGQLTITPYVQMVTSDGRYVAKQATTVPIKNGQINVTLVANDTQPGSYYKVLYQLTDGTAYQETWVVPTSASALKIGNVVATQLSPVVGIVKLDATGKASAATLDDITMLGLGSAATTQASNYDLAGASAAALASAIASSAQKNANLGDLTSIPAARANLGIQSAGLLPASAFEPAGAVSGAIISLNLSQYLNKSGNLGGLSDPAAARGNLGEGSISTHAFTDVDPAGAAAAAQAASLQKTANLADLGDIISARLHLGIGDIATHSFSEVDTAGSATTALNSALASSLQKNANLADLVSIPAALATLGIKSAGLQDSSAFDAAGTAVTAANTAQSASLQKNANLLDLTDIQAARGHMGLGSAALQPTTAFDVAGAAAAAQALSLQIGMNLGDLTDIPLARAHLGMGDIVTHNAADFEPAGTAAALISGGVSSASATALQKTANLADLASIPAALNILGIKSAALQPSSAFDAAGAALQAQTLAQGSSFQITNSLSEIKNPAAARGYLGILDAALHPASDFDANGSAAAVKATSLQKQFDLQDIHDAATARGNLGEGSVSTHAYTEFDLAGSAAAAQNASAQKNQNLNDLSDKNAALLALGLSLNTKVDTTNASNISTGTLGAARLPSVVLRSDMDSVLGAVVFNASGASHTSPIKVGPNANKPVTCTLGELYFDTGATPGQNFLYCTALNTWTSQVGGGGAGGGLLAANNLAELTNVVTARSNLQLGSASLLNNTDVARLALNLGDIPDPAAARRNLGIPSTFVDTSNANNITSGTLAYQRLPQLIGDVALAAGTNSTTIQTIGGQTAANVAAVTAAWSTPNTPSAMVKLDIAGLLPASVLRGLTGDVTRAAGSTTTTVASVGGQPAANIAAVALAWQTPNAPNSPVKADGTGMIGVAQLPAFTGDVAKAAGASTTTINTVGGQSAANVAASAAAWTAANTANGALRLGAGGLILPAQVPAFTGGDITSAGGSLALTVATVGGQSAANVAAASLAIANTNKPNGILQLNAGGYAPVSTIPALSGDVTKPDGSANTTVASVGGQSAANVGAVAAAYGIVNSANGLLKLDIGGHVGSLQMPALTGDVSAPAGSTVLTLPNIVTPATAPKVTYNAKGQVTGGSPLALGDLPSIASTNLSDSLSLIRTNSNIILGAVTLDAGAAAHAAPAKRGTLASMATAPCNAGDEFFATDAVAGANKYFCTAPNTWTKSSGVLPHAPVAHQFATGVDNAGNILSAQPAATDIQGLAASGLVDTTQAGNISGGTLPYQRLPLPTTTTPGGVQAVNPVAHQFVSSINASGQPVQSQPAAADVSGLAPSAILDTTIASNILTGILNPARLPLPTATTIGGVQSVAPVAHQVINSIGTNGVATTVQLAAADITGLSPSAVSDTTNASNILTGMLSAALLPNPTATTIGGVKSLVATPHNYVTGLSTTGGLTTAQPSAADISGLSPSATIDTTNANNITGGQLIPGLLPSVAVRTDTSYALGFITADSSQAAHTLPAKKGPLGAMPATCTLSEQYFATDAAAGANLYGCTALNTWSVMSGGGGGAAGGAKNAIQFNSGVGLAGDTANLYYDPTAHTAYATGGFAANGPSAGKIQLTQGPTPTLAQNSFMLFAPPSIPTSYQWQVPAADINGLLRVQGDIISGVGLAGSDSNVLTAGNVSGAAGTNLCLDGVGGATTLGCAAGGGGGGASAPPAGMVKSTGTALATAVGGADYEFPLTFTGIASRTGNTVTVTAPSGSVPTTSALGQSFQNNGTGLIVSTPALEAAAVGIICDGSTDNGVTGNNSLNAATLSGHAVHLTDGATCVGQINGGVNNTRFYCNGCTLADPTTDVSTSLVHLAFAKNIMFDGIALDTRGTNHQSFQGNSTAQSSVITASGGSGWQANYRIPFNSTGGGCVWNAAGYITTDGSGIPNGVVTYTTGQGCTSQPTTWNIGTYCGDGLSGCVAPTLSWQGGLSLVAGTANAPVTYVEFSTGIVFRNCTWRATGATLANLKGNQDAVKTFSSQVLFENPTVENTLRGSHFFVDSNGDETRKTTIRNVASDGSQIDGVQIKGYPGGTEVDGGLITNVGDAFAGSGQQGNAISVLNTSRNYVHGVTIRDPYFSGVRVTGDNNHNTTRPTSNNRIEDITIAGNLEMGVWAELGSEFNYFKNITVRPSFDQPSAGCLEDTNITQRAHYGYNYFTNMHCTGQIGKGAVIEHAVLKDSTFVDVAVPIQVGFGGTSTGNVVSGNTCTNSGSGYSSPSVCFALDRFNAGNDPTKGPSLIRWNSPVDYPFGGTATVPIAYLELTNFPVLSGITATNPAVFSYLPATAVQWPYSVGSTYMLQGIYGFLNAAGQSINGKLCGVTAVDTTAHTVTCGGVTGVPALDATSYTATPFTMAPAGRANAMPYWIYSGGNTTPAWPANTQMNVTNAF